MPRIFTLSGDMPHASWGNWEDFLQSCQKRITHYGVIWYSKLNCNYILFPDGLLYVNYGFAGQTMMENIRRNGKDAVEALIKDIHNQIVDILGKRI